MAAGCHGHAEVAANSFTFDSRCLHQSILFTTARPRPPRRLEQRSTLARAFAGTVDANAFVRSIKSYGFCPSSGLGGAGAEKTQALQFLGDSAHEIAAGVMAYASASIDKFRKAHPKPRQATARSNAATKRLPKLIRMATELLNDQLDGLAVQYPATDPAFYAEYQTARRIVGASTNRSSSDANVVPAPNSTPSTKAAQGLTQSTALAGPGFTEAPLCSIEAE